MTTYIDTETSTYPLHSGDAPNDVIPETWEEVPYSEPPDTSKGQVAFEGVPLLLNGTWVRQWLVRSLSEEEKSPIMFMLPHEQREFEEKRLTDLQKAETKKILDTITGDSPNVIG